MLAFRLGESSRPSSSSPPIARVVKLLSFWQGLAGAMMWIAGLSLVQMVAPGRKGLSNGLMMASVGVGSIVGPLSGRAMLYHRELLGLLPERARFPPS